MICLFSISLVLVSGCLEEPPVANGNQGDYRSDENPEIFGIIQVDEEGIISRTDEDMGCNTPVIHLYSYLLKDEGAECISTGPTEYTITGSEICGGTKVTVFEKLLQKESCDNWYHVRTTKGIEGWLADGFFSKQVCSTDEDCKRITCTNPPMGEDCAPALYDFTVCDAGLCK